MPTKTDNATKGDGKAEESSPFIPTDAQRQHDGFRIDEAERLWKEFQKSRALDVEMLIRRTRAYITALAIVERRIDRLVGAMRPICEELDEKTVGYDLTDGSWNDDASLEIQLTVKEINSLRAALLASEGKQP